MWSSAFYDSILPLAIISLDSQILKLAMLKEEFVE